MIIWGFKKRIYDQTFSGTAECPSCRQRDFRVQGVLRYVHLFWIPLFSFSKKLTAECLKCGSVSGKKELNDAGYSEIRKELFPLKRTLGKNFGILTAALVFILFGLMVLVVAVIS